MAWVGAKAQLRLVPTARFSIFTPAFPSAKDGALTIDEAYFEAAGHDRKHPVTELGVGDSALMLDVAGGDRSFFERVRDEICWEQMMHKGSPVPRLVCMQGSFSDTADTKEGAEPIYRHPADDQPQMVAWTPTVTKLKAIVEAALGGQQLLNHALIQYYRGGDDYISEHADKTLDVHRGSSIVNLSLGATRTMVLRLKKEGGSNVAGSIFNKSRHGTRPSRATQRVALPDSSLFVLGWNTNLCMTHEIKQDRRLDFEKTPGELDFHGERISLTFRSVSTFKRLSDGCLFGQGAPSKTEAALNRAVGLGLKVESNDLSGIVNVAAETNRMIRMFSIENRSADFNWDSAYGKGFNVLTMAGASSTTETTGMSEVLSSGNEPMRSPHEESLEVAAASVCREAETCVLTPLSFFLAWNGVLVLTYEGFPPSLEGVKSRLNSAHCSLFGPENFGSKWPKTTLAATADGATLLSLDDLAALRRICINHSLALQLISKDAAITVNTLSVVHYSQRGLEEENIVFHVPLSPPSSTSLSSEPSAQEKKRVTGVIEEWTGPKLSSYLSLANKQGSNISSYRESSPTGSTLVGFLSDVPAALALSLTAFQEAIDSAFPGRFVWMKSESLHCTIRSLD